MNANEKIYVNKYLNDLNSYVDNAITHGHINKEYVHKLTCKELAELCNVTQATITNLSTNSKFFLIYTIADAILDSYFAYFSYDESSERAENPDCSIYPRDRNYIIMCLTTYYTESWLYE